MDTPPIKKKKTGGQRFVWWGWFVIFVPIITLILTFVGHTAVSLFFKILGESSP